MFLAKKHVSWFTCRTLSSKAPTIHTTCHQGHFSSRTPVIWDTYHLYHLSSETLSSRTHVTQDTFHIGYLSFRTPVIQDITDVSPVKRIIIGLICGHNTDAISNYPFVIMADDQVPTNTGYPLVLWLQTVHHHNLDSIKKLIKSHPVYFGPITCYKLFHCGLGGYFLISKY